MAIEVRTKTIVFIEKLVRELKDHDTLKMKYDSVMSTGDQLSVAFFSDLDPTELAAFDVLINGFEDVDDYNSVTPKICGIAKAEAHTKHFHNINYKTEVRETLYPKRDFVEGELRTIEWFSDEALTDLIIRVDVAYTRDTAGFALHRTTTRTWYHINGTPNPETKITHKSYTININEMIQEGIKRRSNIVDLMKINALGMMQQVLTSTHTPEEIIGLGRDFLLLHKNVMNAFIDESHKQIVIDIGAADAAHDFWLDQDMMPGVTFRGYMISQLSI